MKSFSDTLYHASKSGHKFRDPSSAVQARTLMAHIIKLGKELERWERKNQKTNMRKRKAIEEVKFRFMVKYDLAYRGNPKGLDDLTSFADDLKAGV